MPQRKLLLADDSITIQKVVNLTFADEGFDVITVNNGDEALRQISEQRPDIVLADVNIPGPNGYEICEMIRSIEEIRDLPVVLLVGSYEPFDPDRAQHVGANDFLTKPFSSIRQLVATVSNLTPEQPVAMPSEQLPEPEDLPSPNADTLPMEHPNSAQEVTAVEAGEDSPSIETVPGAPEPGGEVTAETVEYSPAFTDDIENLYDQSLAATIEIPHMAAVSEPPGETDQAEPSSESPYQPLSETSPEPSLELGDSSMDDEMIETVYVEEPETPEQEELEQPIPAAETEQHTQHEETPTFEVVAPPEKPGDSSVEPTAELSEGAEHNFLRNLAEQQPASYLSNKPENETFFEAEPEQESEPEPEPESAGDEAMAFRAEEPVPSGTNGNGTYPHGAEEHPSEEPQFAETASGPEQPTPWDSVAHPQPFNPPPVDTVPTEEFEESDLLDLGETAEHTSPATRQESSSQDAGAPQFSDDLIDRIADRVVAKLSEQLVREIADRIVPDAVESFILKKFGRTDDR